jgi:hypothetical protein
LKAIRSAVFAVERIERAKRSVFRLCEMKAENDLAAQCERTKVKHFVAGETRVASLRSVKRKFVSQIKELKKGSDMPGIYRLSVLVSL